MKGYINSIDWINIEPMKYWSFTASTSQQQKYEIVKNAIFSLDYIGALKVDGYYQRIIKDEDGSCFMIARSRNVRGEVVNKIEWVPQLIDWLKDLPNGTCLLSECYLPNNEGSNKVTSILGCLKDKAILRQEKTPLNFYIFDIMAYNGENYIHTKFKDRVHILKEISKKYSSSYIQYAEYYQGEELWENIQTYLSEGKEGVVIMRKDAIVYQKRTPAKVSIKIKKELQDTLDVVILDKNEPTRLYGGKEILSWKYWENIRTGEKLNAELYKEYSEGAPIEPVTKNYFFGWAGSLVIGVYNSTTKKYCPIGSLSGLTEEVLSNWKNYIGKVVEITGMQIFRDNNGNFSGIRHPKLIAFRSDKDKKECTMEQLL